MIDWDAMTAGCIDVFAIPVVYEGRTINAIFNDVTEQFEDGSDRGIVRRRVSLEAKSLDVPTAAEGDSVTVNGTDYIVVAALPDGNGYTELQLRL